jgi:MoaA/NifB/PqqE/SkfB family radical SAM enzyme
MIKPLCSAADTSLFVDTDGQVGLCCAGKRLGNLRNESLADIFNKDEFKKIQKKLAEGEFPDYCITCQDQERQAKDSGYYHHINHFFPSNGYRQLQHLDIRWNNICNLSCRYCDPLASSQWMKLYNMPLTSPKRDYISELLTEIEKNKHSIKGISLLGGEPFLQKPNEQLFDIIEKDTKIDIVTNLSVDLENNKIYQLVKKFNNVSFNISFENVGNRFEYVRAGASWERLVKNIEILKRDFGKNIGCLGVYNIWSATNLDELYQFCNDYQIPITWQLANYRWESLDPTEGFIVEGHNPKVIIKAVEQIDYIMSKYRLIAAHASRKDFLHNIKVTISNARIQQYKSQDFLEWIESNERLIKPKMNFVHLWPELYSYMLQK